MKNTVEIEFRIKLGERLYFICASGEVLEPDFKGDHPAIVGPDLEIYLLSGPDDLGGQRVCEADLMFDEFSRLERVAVTRLYEAFHDPEAA